MRTTRDEVRYLFLFEAWKPQQENDMYIIYESDSFFIIKLFQEVLSSFATKCVWLLLKLTKTYWRMDKGGIYRYKLDCVSRAQYSAVWTWKWVYRTARGSHIHLMWGCAGQSKVVKRGMSGFYGDVKGVRNGGGGRERSEKWCGIYI